MKVVLVRFRSGERREFTLSGETTMLGRRPDSTLRVASSDVSRQHCQIVVKDGAVLVKDLGSSNGTFVNGQRVAEKALSPGDRLTVGPVVFIVQIDGEPAEIKPTDAEVEAAAAAPSGPSFSLDDDEGEVFELGEGDFDIDEAISSLDELDEDKDLP
ncbi:MAG: FHA domain-containing protein [Phycisphaerae bacterium]|jgi:pSer/pThr/pTyr-binding forkhead associated (FHA) protein